MWDTEHFHYEIAMMSQCLALWDFPITPVMNNMSIECFDLHAYNMINFLEEEGANWGENTDFVNDYMIKVQDQVLTLTEARTSVTAEKIQPADCYKIYNILTEKIKQMKERIKQMTKEQYFGY